MYCCSVHREMTFISNFIDTTQQGRWKGTVVLAILMNSLAADCGQLK